MDQFKILGVKIDNLSKKEVYLKLEEFLESRELNHIVTVNPEIILRAQEDPIFLKIINRACLSVADGIGVRFAFWRFGRHLKCRLTGIDLTWKILELSNQKKLAILLVSNKNGLSTWQETREAILKKYPDLKINGISIDPTAGHYDRSIELAILKKKEGYISYDVLLCNLGAPHQEKFIAELNRWSDWFCLAMGVGGSFDFITGKVSRAPKFMRVLGLEWLWRIFSQPANKNEGFKFVFLRIRRVLKAIVIFPIRVLFNR